MVKLALNRHKFNNYAFFCPVSKLHLTVSNPVGYANEVTPAILRAVKVNTLIDVDGVIDIETGTVKDAQQVNTPVQETPKSPEETGNADTTKDNTPEQSAKVEENPVQTPTSENGEEVKDEDKEKEKEASAETEAEAPKATKKGRGKAKEAAEKDEKAE